MENGRRIQRPSLLPRREPRRHQVSGLAGRRVPLRTGYTRTQPLARTSDRKRRMPQGGKRRGAEDPQRRHRFARLLHRVGGFHRRRPRHAAWRDMHSGRPADLLRSENGRRSRARTGEDRKRGHRQRGCPHRVLHRPAGQGPLDQRRLLLAQRREVLRPHRRADPQDQRVQAHPRGDRIGSDLRQLRFDHRRGAGLRPFGRP